MKRTKKRMKRREKNTKKIRQNTLTNETTSDVSGIQHRNTRGKRRERDCHGGRRAGLLKGLDQYLFNPIHHFTLGGGVGGVRERGSIGAWIWACVQSSERQWRSGTSGHSARSKGRETTGAALLSGARGCTAAILLAAVKENGRKRMVSQWRVRLNWVYWYWDVFSYSILSTTMYLLISSYSNVNRLITPKTHHKNTS